MARLGCMSKRYRKFHLSSPSLEININEIPNQKMKKCSCNMRLQLIYSLDRYLFRRGDNKIKRFHIRWVTHNRFTKDCACDERFRIIAWVYNAIRCNVEELDLDVSLPRETPLALSSFMFLCKSLTSLSVSMKCVLKGPPLDSSSNLKYLSLREVCIVDEKFFTWITCCCKCIKEFRLQDIYGVANITIESSSLESFVFECPGLSAGCNLNISGQKLECLHIRWGNLFFDQKSSLNISAPNLKSLTWWGTLFSHQNLGKLMCLEKAELSLQPESGIDFGIIHKVLHSMRGVKVLILHKKITMKLLKEGSIALAALFGTEISYLQMHIECLFDNLVPAMVSLLSGMPKLNTLYLKTDQFSFSPEYKSSGFGMAYWKSQKLAFINQVKVVSIELCSGSNGFELARYILEHAQNLNKLEIIHSAEQSNAIRELNESKRVSNAAFVFEEDRQRGTRKQAELN
ncbi:putative F-box/FBD/LRR-repeat protein At4g03220 [Malus domestica]|uniref:putative F-box/FBD/LRR-repeat protein At4g03220 n=1 Tax=Malus domestica TaxID=3750 RepID=UPI003974F99A